MGCNSLEYLALSRLFPGFQGHVPQVRVGCSVFGSHIICALLWLIHPQAAGCHPRLSLGSASIYLSHLHISHLLLLLSLPLIHLVLLFFPSSSSLVHALLVKADQSFLSSPTNVQFLTVVIISCSLSG